MKQVCHIEVTRKALYSCAGVFKYVHKFMVLNYYKLVLTRIRVISSNALFLKNSHV
jgi:hypothetical protein